MFILIENKLKYKAVWNATNAMNNTNKICTKKENQNQNINHIDTIKNKPIKRGID